MNRRPVLYVVLGMALVGCDKTWDTSDATAGEELFAEYCEQCHGPGGDVRAADQYSPQTPDLRRITERMAGGRIPRSMLREYIDGRRLTQAEGSRTMPVWGEILDGDGDASADEKLDALAGYIESIQLR